MVKALGSLLAVTFLLLGMTTSSAVPIGLSFAPTIVAGDPNGIPPDSPDNRIDPNLPTSPFSGVVAVGIRYIQSGSQLSFLCSGTLISRRHVLTAAHCLDTDDLGHIVDITQPGNDVRVAFNGDATHEIFTAVGVSMNPFFQGFFKCAFPEPFNCINDDIAVITLGQDAPSTARNYRVFTGDVTTGQLTTMVGYGASGDGVNGYTVDGDSRVKRFGQNIMDLFDRDDEQHFSPGSRQENWFADFDGLGKDKWCTELSICTQILANDKESTVGGGDSGGAAFLALGDEYLLMGNLTFARWDDLVPGTFGTAMGGNLLGAYGEYLEATTGGLVELVSSVPEPATLALLILGFAGLELIIIRRKQAHPQTSAI